MNIKINPDIKSKTPNFFVGIMIADVTIQENPELDSIIQTFEHDLSHQFKIEDVVNLPIIKDGREAYKIYGKDPSRYRLAVESLYRRIVKGNQLYRINNVVDLGNVLSLRTRKSVAILDYHQIDGDVEIRLGTEMDQYEGIGRGQLNISNIPLYADNLGPFGSTTSDTDRTKITEKTSRIICFIISFSGSESLHEELDYAATMYQQYADAKIIKTWVI